MESLPLESDSPQRLAPAASIVHRRLGTVGAMLLALGGAASLEKPESPPRPDAPSHQALLSIPANTRTGIPEEVSVEDFRAEGTTFTCRFGEREVRGSLNESGGITTVQFDNLTITLTSPVSQNTLERFLRSATGTATLLAARGNAPDEHTLTALGSARFQFLQTRGGKPSAWVATSRDLLNIDPAQEQEREKALQQWKVLLGAVRDRTNIKGQMIDERLKVNNARMRAVYDDLTSRSEWYHPHSYERSYWQEHRSDFVYGWDVIVERWGAASEQERRALLSAFHTYLLEWEAWLSLHPQTESEEAFAARHQKLLDEIVALQRDARAASDRAHTRVLHDPTNSTVITERSSLLSPKNFTREHRSGAGLLLRNQMYEDDVLVKEMAYDAHGNIAKETASQYFPGGQIRRVQEHTPKDGTLTLQRQTEYWRNGNTHAILDQRSDAFAYFGERGDLLYEDVARSHRAKRQRGMVDAKGERFGLYRDEVAKNKNLTVSQYIDMLARKLDTEEKMAVFFEQFLWYASDGDNADYWQTSEETVRRMEEKEDGGAHYMRGDCDDYAFLARDILRRQGKNAHVTYIPGHAICIWVEKDGGGRYHARAQDTFGSDHNGNRYGRDETRDREKAKGYAKLIDALNALMKKYRYGGLGLQEGQDYRLDENAISIMPNPPSGTYRSVTADFFLQKVS